MKEFKKPHYKLDVARSLKELAPGESVLFDTDEAKLYSLRSAATKFSALNLNSDIRIREYKGRYYAINEVRVSKEKKVVAAATIRRVKQNGVTIAEAKVFLGKQLILARGNHEKALVMMKQFEKHLTTHSAESKGNAHNVISRKVETVKLAIKILENESK